MYELVGYSVETHVEPRALEAAKDEVVNTSS